MGYFRSLSASLLSAAITFCLVSSSACGTGAVGVDECRDIEQARCRASKPCGVVDDVDECERYYRDHCLHGLATKPPAGASVDECVQVIEAAGRCAAGDPTIALSDCDPVVTEPTTRRLRGATACEIVAHPELTTECAFLLDTPPVAEGAAGAAGSDGSGTAGAPAAAAGAATE